MSDFLSRNSEAPTVVDVDIQGNTAVDFKLSVMTTDGERQVWTRNPSVLLTPPYPTDKKLIGQYIQSYLNSIEAVPFENVAGNEEGVGPTMALFADIVQYYTNDDHSEIDLSPRTWSNEYVTVNIKTYATA